MRRLDKLTASPRAAGWTTHAQLRRVSGDAVDRRAGVQRGNTKHKSLYQAQAAAASSPTLRKSAEEVNTRLRQSTIDRFNAQRQPTAPATADVRQGGHVPPPRRRRRPRRRTRPAGKAPGDVALVHDMEYLATEEGVELIGAATTIEKAYRGHDIRHKAAWVAVSRTPPSRRRSDATWRRTRRGRRRRRRSASSAATRRSTKR